MTNKNNLDINDYNEIKKIISNYICTNEYEIKNKSEIKQILKIISKINKNDYKLIGTGSHSKVYRIGNKVLKIGLATNNNIIKNKHIVNIYYKNNLKIKTLNYTLAIRIEIQDYVDKILLSEEKLYHLYEELRDDNIIWCDIKNSNIGIINNKIVIIDTDNIYNRKKDIHFYNNIDKKFYERYNKKNIKGGNNEIQ